MFILRIEHPTSNFAAWKQTFDSFAEKRRSGGVRQYQVLRQIDDPNYVMIDLTFDSSDAAEAFLGFLRGIWQAPMAAQVLRGAPQTRIAAVAESQQI
jgi:hypothetical protein